MYNQRTNDYYNTFIEPYIYQCGGHDLFLRHELGALSELADGLWQLNLLNKFIALYPFAGRSRNTHAVNLINPKKYKIRWSGNITHNANGITGAGGIGFTDIPLVTMSDFKNIHLSAYNRTKFSDITGSGRFIGVNTLQILKDLKDVGALELNFNRVSGIVGYVYNTINSLGGFGYSIQEMENLNINGTGFMIGINDNKCYLNNQIFGKWFPLLPTDIHNQNPRSLTIFGNNYDNSITSTINANLAFLSIGYGLSENDVYNYTYIVEKFQKAMFRSVM